MPCRNMYDMFLALWTEKVKVRVLVGSIIHDTLFRECSLFPEILFRMDKCILSLHGTTPMPAYRLLSGCSNRPDRPLVRQPV